MLKTILRTVLRGLYRVQVSGADYLRIFGERTLVVANHTSFLDALLLYAYLPVPATFAINTYVARSWMGRVGGRFANLFPLDPTNPLSIRALIRRVQQGGCVVIFPEGRITVTGALMKVYHGPGLVADRSKATVLPIRIEGAQYTPFSRLRGRARLSWFPKISLIVQPPRCLVVQASGGRDRREQAGRLLTELMSDMMFETANQNQTLVERLLEARRIHGGGHTIAADITRKPLDYDALLLRAHLLGRQLRDHAGRGETIGVLLPSTLAAVATFWGLVLRGRIPAMLNHTLGTQGLGAACRAARLRRVITSRQFVEKAHLEDVIAALGDELELIYLEDVAARIRPIAKLRALFASRFDGRVAQEAERDPQRPAIVLFTSGSEGTPKGVVLSHRNLLSNIHQLAARIDFNAQDVALNALPLFHSFGMTAGMLLPLTSGVRVFFYPSPLHYRVIPEVAYDINATILFGTNTFLAGYARFAHPYDFYSLRYVFAGAEKLQDEVRRHWQEKFGIRIFEGYGATETSPVLAANTPLAHRPGTVGRLMPGIEYRLIAVPGLVDGQRLQVRGPNVMLGYLLHERPGVLQPPATELGRGWYDTGDIVTIDSEGFLRIRGRAKRFAKVAGEMVSLTAVETLATSAWPESMNAALAVPDERKGEQILLLSTAADPDRAALLAQAQSDGVAEICVPRKVLHVAELPMHASGKIDYVAASQLARTQLPTGLESE